MTRTTSILWPEAELGCPKREGYQMSVRAMFDRTSIAEAPPAFTRTRVDERRDYACAFTWRLDQLDAFRDFFVNVLNSGMRFFMMRHIGLGIMEPMMCQIVTPYSLEPHPDHTALFNTGFSVQGWWRVDAPPDWT